MSITNGMNLSVIGNLTRDPELRFTPNGVANANVGLAINRRFLKNDAWEEQVSFLNATAWGELGEHIVETLKKGDRVVVLGRLDQQNWEDKETGDKRSAFQLTIEDIGPSLRWATATVAKVAKNGGGGSRQDQPPVNEEPYGDF